MKKLSKPNILLQPISQRCFTLPTSGIQLPAYCFAQSWQRSQSFGVCPNAFNFRHRASNIQLPTPGINPLAEFAEFFFVRYQLVLKSIDPNNPNSDNHNVSWHWAFNFRHRASNIQLPTPGINPLAEFAEIAEFLSSGHPPILKSIDLNNPNSDNFKVSWHWASSFRHRASNIQLPTPGINPLAEFAEIAEFLSSGHPPILKSIDLNNPNSDNFKVSWLWASSFRHRASNIQLPTPDINPLAELAEIAKFLSSGHPPILKSIDLNN
ncbi:MAG: hypothetical protein IPL46_28790 [Saprospiraceae bacterium]|nr:hypothetical protein [Saprospiraceae bacterium]